MQINLLGSKKAVWESSCLFLATSWFLSSTLIDLLFLLALQLKLVLYAYFDLVVLFHACLKLFRFFRLGVRTPWPSLLRPWLYSDHLCKPDLARKREFSQLEASDKMKMKSLPGLLQCTAGLSRLYGGAIDIIPSFVNEDYAPSVLFNILLTSVLQSISTIPETAIIYTR